MKAIFKTLNFVPIKKLYSHCKIVYEEHSEKNQKIKQ